MVNDRNQPFDFENRFYSWRKHWSKSDLVLTQGLTQAQLGFIENTKDLVILTQAPRVYKPKFFWCFSSTQTLVQLKHWK